MRKNIRITTAVEHLFNLYLELPKKHQDDIQSQMEVGHGQLGASLLAARFLRLAASTITKKQFNILKSMVIYGSELESAEQKKQRMRRQRKLAQATR